MKVTAFCLIGIIVSLLCVSFISGTITRHIIQISPLIALIIIIRQQNGWKSFAAFPIFIFWFLIMFFIWLHLLGMAKIVQGHFTTGEVVLSIIMGMCSLAGAINSWKYLFVKNIFPKIILTASTIALSVVFMYIWQIGNILNNYHNTGGIVTAIGLSFFLLLCIGISLRDSYFSKPFYAALLIFGFSLIQVIAMWVSFQQSFAHD
jgi:hypothetical protein